MLAHSRPSRAAVGETWQAMQQLWATLIQGLLRPFPSLAARADRRSPPPMLFSVLFWGTLVGVHIIPVLGIFGETWRFGVWWTVAMSVALVLVWLAVPWSRTASPWQKAAAIVFPVAVMLLDQTLGDSVWAESLYLVAIANGVLMFGVARGLIFAGWVLFCHFLDYLLNSVLYSLSTTTIPFQFSATPDEVLDAFFWTALFAPYAGFAIGVCLLYLSVLRSREETLVLLQENAVVHGDLQKANLALSQQLQQSRELVILEERARIARDIHDTLGHHLTAINLQLEHARRFRVQQPEVAWDEVGETKALALEALAEVRRCVRALKPLALEERSGLGALSALSRSFESSDLEVLFSVVGAPYPLATKVELTLYRALQGSLTNTVRHARARRIAVTVTFATDDVCLRVVDDGQGASNGLVKEGFGLEAIRERAALLGGRLVAENNPAGGFLFAVWIPTAEKVH